MSNTEETGTVGKGHNSDAARALLMHHLNAIGPLEKQMAALKGKIGAAYKEAKVDGISKKDIKFAQDLQKDRDEQMLERRRRETEIALWLQHPIGTQIEMFDQDRTPVAERAFEQGKNAGMKGETCNPPHAESTEQGQKWIEGWHIGQKAIFNIKKSDPEEATLLRADEAKVERTEDDDALDEAGEEASEVEEPGSDEQSKDDED